MYVEDKTHGELLPFASNEVLAELIQRARDLIADPIRIGLSSRRNFPASTAWRRRYPR